MQFNSLEAYSNRVRADTNAWHFGFEDMRLLTLPTIAYPERTD